MFYDYAFRCHILYVNTINFFFLLCAVWLDGELEIYNEYFEFIGKCLRKQFYNLENIFDKLLTKKIFLFSNFILIS